MKLKHTLLAVTLKRADSDLCKRRDSDRNQPGAYIAMGWGTLPGPLCRVVPWIRRQYPNMPLPCIIPPAMPKALNGGPPGVDYYKIAARQISQQVLP